MFRIDTGQARTDLYGLNKGLAQVFDTSAAIHGIDQTRAANERKAAAKARKAQEAENEVYGSLDTLNKLAVLDRERPMFAEKQTALYNNVKKNIDKIRSGDTNALLAFKQELSGVLTAAELSKNTREQVEAASKTMLTDGFDKYRPESLGYIEDYVTNPAYNGTYNFDPSQLKKNINYNERVIKDLSSYAQKMAKDSPFAKVFTKQQADELIADDLSDPIYFEQAAYDFNKATDKLGAKTPVEFYQKKYAPSLIVSDTKAGPEWMTEGGKSKEPKIRVNYSKSGDNKGVLNWEYVTPPDNPYITTSIGDVRPGLIHDDGDKTYMEVTTKPNSDGDFEKRRLGYQETLDFIRLKLGTTLNELRKGEAQKHIDLKNEDIQSSVAAGHAAAEKTRGGSSGTKKGEERAVQGGTAVYDGTKWVMKK